MTPEENELLTRVGPGTPCGELLRRYWFPVATLPELSEDTPTKFVRILGEDLVLFRDKSGRVGLIGDHCPHRGASLLYGRVEERGIACAYHGWLYDTEGYCLETPAEPADSMFYLTVKHVAYPVRERYGMYWAYLGPKPEPVLPRYDFVELAPIKSIGHVSRQDCNWLQVVENNLDQSHVFILHQDTAQRGITGLNTARGMIDELAGLEYTEVLFGIQRRQTYKSGYDDIDLMVFPSSQRIYNHMSIKVPIDDTHTMQFILFAQLPQDGASESSPGNRGAGTIEYSTRLPSKNPPDAIHPLATYQLDGVQSQDLMALETQGAIAQRENEHLATADKGIVLLRELLKREIARVQQGFDPMGVIRDPDEDLIDTHIQVYMEMIQRFPPELARRR